MKNCNILKAGPILCLLMVFSCENIDDTYKQWTGDGKVRYLGRCDDIEIQTGWKRFLFTWNPSSDPLITHIRIDWNNEAGGSGSYLIPAGQTSFVTPPEFEDMFYTIDFYSVRQYIEDGQTKETLSIPVTLYARPITSTHGLVIGFPKGVYKYYFLGSDLILLLDEYQEGMNEVVLNYRSNGEEKQFDILAEMMKDVKYVIIEDIDDSEPNITRKADVEDSIDEIVFEPYYLNKDTFQPNYDFIQQIKNAYDIEELTYEWALAQTKLELDYSMISLEDILYFRNLRELILGGNRYTVTLPEWTNVMGELTDKEISVFALKTLTSILGTNLTIHNNSYDLRGYAELDAVAEHKGNPELPELKYLDTADWKISYTLEDGDDPDPVVAGNLLDNDPSTGWTPLIVRTAVRTHLLTIDMKSPQTISGFKLTQYNSTDQINYTPYYPALISILKSDSGGIWEDTFKQIRKTLGNNPGESTVLYLSEPVTCRYLRIVVADQIDGSIRNVSLGDFMVFRD